MLQQYDKLPDFSLFMEINIAILNDSFKMVSNTFKYLKI